MKDSERSDVHVVSRSAHPAYPPRTPVPDELVPFEVPWPEYKPVDHTDPAVFANDCTRKPNGWADPADISLVPAADWARRREAGPLTFVDGVPRNPCGRTGMVGRGLLGKWGPNYTADPVVTRWHPEEPNRLQMVAIRRRDTGDWAIPGGMVDPGEHVSVTVRREFEEEAGNIGSQAGIEEFKRLTQQLFEDGRVIYKGYVDEPRNTDNAWLETTVFHFHCGAELGRLLPLQAGDDATAVRWFDIGSGSAQGLYPPHRAWVSQLADTLVSRRQGEDATTVSYVLAPSLTAPMLRRAYEKLVTARRGGVTVDQLAAIFSDARGARPRTAAEAMEAALEVVETHAKEKAGQLTYVEFSRWWESLSASVPKSKWISQAATKFKLQPSLSDCEVASGADGARLVVSRDDDERRVSLTTAAGDEVLALSLRTSGGGVLAYVSKGDLPVATVWQQAGDKAFTVFASRAIPKPNGTITSPVLYSCSPAARGFQLLDARGRLVARVTERSAEGLLVVEPLFDASVVIGVLVAAYAQPMSA
ncbi:hypothetical protein AB1Y20_000081 [Prymnesium parvum]|uniref:Nudix hydrolase domain-containing protein n=1 Tax=Prymnesium parvum TaxID=97485 RepID=A0AB34K7Y6_PRYPA